MERDKLVSGFLLKWFSNLMLTADINSRQQEFLQRILQENQPHISTPQRYVLLFQIPTTALIYDECNNTASKLGSRKFSPKRAIDDTILLRHCGVPMPNPETYQPSTKIDQHHPEMVQ